MQELFGIYHWDEFVDFFEQVMIKNRETKALQAGYRVRAFIAKLFADIGVPANIADLSKVVKADAPLIRQNRRPKDVHPYRSPMCTSDGGSNLVKGLSDR